MNLCNVRHKGCYSHFYVVCAVFAHGIAYPLWQDEEVVDVQNQHLWVPPFLGAVLPL